MGAGRHRINQRLERSWADRESGVALEARYREEARLRAQEYTGYRHVAACSTCDVRPISDGFYGDCVELFGGAEGRAIALGRPVHDPQHFSREQVKKIHPDDLGWLKA